MVIVLGKAAPMEQDIVRRLDSERLFNLKEREREKKKGKGGGGGGGEKSREFTLVSSGNIRAHKMPLHPDCHWRKLSRTRSSSALITHIQGSLDLGVRSSEQVQRDDRHQQQVEDVESPRARHGHPAHHPALLAASSIL